MTPLNFNLIFYKGKLTMKKYYMEKKLIIMLNIYILNKEYML